MTTIVSKPPEGAKTSMPVEQWAGQWYQGAGGVYYPSDRPATPIAIPTQPQPAPVAPTEPIPAPSNLVVVGTSPSTNEVLVRNIVTGDMSWQAGTPEQIRQVTEQIEQAGEEGTIEYPEYMKPVEYPVIGKPQLIGDTYLVDDVSKGITDLGILQGMGYDITQQDIDNAQQFLSNLDNKSTELKNAFKSGGLARYLGAQKHTEDVAKSKGIIDEDGNIAIKDLYALNLQDSEIVRVLNNLNLIFPNDILSQLSEPLQVAYNQYGIVGYIQELQNQRNKAQHDLAALASDKNVDIGNINKITDGEIRRLLISGVDIQPIINTGAEYERVKNVFDKLYQPIGDGTNYMLRTDLVELQQANPELYDIAMMQGYDAYKKAFDIRQAEHEAKKAEYDSIVQNQKEADNILVAGGYRSTKAEYPFGGAPFEAYDTEGAYGYNIQQYLVDTRTEDGKINSESVAVLKNAQFSPEVISDVSQQAQIKIDMLNYVDDFVNKPINQWGGKEFKDSLIMQSQAETLGMLTEGKAGVAIATTPAGYGKSIAVDYKTFWNNLSRDEKDRLAEAIALDPNKSSYFASIVENLNVQIARTPYEPLALALIAPPVGMPLMAAQSVANVVSPYTITNEAIKKQIDDTADYLETAQALPVEQLEVLKKSVEDTGVAVGESPLDTYQSLTGADKQKVATDVTRERLGLTRTTMDKVLAGAMVLAAAMPYAGAAVSKLGFGGRLATATTHAGISGLFITSSIPVLKDPRASYTDKAVALGIDALMLAGLYGATRGITSDVSNKLAKNAGNALNDALRPKTVEAQKPLTQRIGETISNVKTAVKDIPQRAYTAPEAIKYYAEGLKIKTSDLADAVKATIGRINAERANRMLQEVVDKQAERILSDAGLLKGDATIAGEAVKYYGTELRHSISETLKSAYKGLIDIRQAEANRQVQRIVDLQVEKILSGVEKGEFKTVVDAIRYYSGDIKHSVIENLKSLYRGMAESQQRQADNLVREAVDREAERILGDIVKGDFATAGDALKYYSSELQGRVKKSLVSFYDSIVESRQAEADKIINEIVDREARRILDDIVRGDLANLSDALKYYSKEIKRAVSDVIKATVDDIEQARLKQAQRIIDEYRLKDISDAEADILAKFPEMVKYYVENLVLETSSKGKALADSVTKIFTDISKAIRNKDRQTIIDRARTLEEVSVEFDDGKIADMLKEKAREIEKNADEYIKKTESMTDADTTKIRDVVNVAEQAVRETYNDLLTNTRPIRLEDVTPATREGVVSREVIDFASREYDYLVETQRQKNLERLVKQEREVTAQDVETYIDAQRARTENIPKMERISKDMTIDDIENYIDALRARVKNLEGLDKYVAEQTLDDLQTFLDSQARLGKSARNIIPEEGTIKYETINQEEKALTDAINRDIIRLNELQNIEGAEYEVSQAVNRLNENMAKLAKLRGQINPMKGTKGALEQRLKEMGYKDEEIARMTDMEKVERVANDIPPEREMEKLEELFGRPEKPEGGIVTKEKIEVKEKTAEELEKELYKEKEIKPEEKIVEEKPEVKTEEKVKTKTGTDIGVKATQAEGAPYKALVWEDGRIYVKTIFPQILPEGFGITEEEARAFPLTKVVPEFVVDDKGQIIRKVRTEEKGVSAPFVAPMPIPAEEAERYPKPFPEAKPETEPQLLPEEPIPTKIPEPIPEITPEPEMIEPFPKPTLIPEPKPYPEVPPPEVRRPSILSPPPLVLLEGKMGKERITPPAGSIVWRQGMKWALLPPPYRDEDMIYLDYPPKGVKKFAVGKGSAYKTLDVLGGRPPNDADVDMGWAQIHISSKTGKMEISFGGGEEAANERWEMERQYMDELERESYYNLPTAPMTMRIPRQRIRPSVAVESEVYPQEMAGEEAMPQEESILEQIERHRAGRVPTRTNSRYEPEEEEMIYIAPHYRRKSGAFSSISQSGVNLPTRTYLGRRLRPTSVGTGV